MNIFSSKMAIDKDLNHGFWFDAHGNLKLVVVSGSSTEKYSEVFSEADSFYKKLIDFFNRRSSVIGPPPSSSGLQNAFATTEIEFYALQSALTQGAYDSTMYSTIFALFLLTLLTRRFVSSVLVAFHLVCVVVCVLGTFVQLGWTLGIVESIVVAPTVGLACDFAAHLAHSFNEEPLENETPFTFPRTRIELLLHLELSKEKATRAVTNLGAPVTMGFFSTFFSGCCLLVTIVYFTQQFGIFMCSMMTFSFSYAFLYLIPALASIGWRDRLLAKWTHDKIMNSALCVLNQGAMRFGTKVAVEEEF